jgi:hypothetical protein
MARRAKKRSAGAKASGKKTSKPRRAAPAKARIGDLTARKSTKGGAVAATTPSVVQGRFSGGVGLGYG